MRWSRTGWIAAAGLAILIAVLVWWFLLRKPAAQEAPDPTPTALVTLTPVRAGDIGEVVSAYGVIAGSPSATRTIAAPRAVIVVQLLVTPGQPVAAGAPLIVVTNTPATELGFRQTTAAVDFARRDLARVQRLYDEHLATNDQLGLARKALSDAQAAVTAQVQAGAGDGRQTITAPSAGVVGATPVAVGDHVAADAPLLTLIASGGLVAELGVEPTKAAPLAVGQPVALASPFDPVASVRSRLTEVGREVNPTSKLVTVTAPVHAPGLPLGASVEGRVTVGSHPGLLVPSASVVYDESGSHLFVVRGGVAHEMAVKAGDPQGADIEVAGPIRAGEPIVLEGAYQLQDGMAVRTRRR